MARAQFQVLVFPYRLVEEGKYVFAIFRRSDEKYWQGIAGGGEGEETPLDAAKRETFEESGLSQDSHFIALSSTTTIPVVNIAGFQWGEDVLVIPEYTFGVQAQNSDLLISKEHMDVQWHNYEDSYGLLKWDSNKNALWELNHRITLKRD